jgi:hypothetical protein
MDEICPKNKQVLLRIQNENIIEIGSLLLSLVQNKSCTPISFIK